MMPSVGFLLSNHVGDESTSAFEPSNESTSKLFVTLNVTVSPFLSPAGMRPYSLRNDDCAAVRIHTAKCSLFTPTSGEMTCGNVS